MFDAFATPDPFYDQSFLVEAVGREENLHRLTDHFRRAVAEDDLGAPVPAQDNAGQVLADDGVIGGLDNGGEESVAQESVGKLSLGRDRNSSATRTNARVSSGVNPRLLSRDNTTRFGPGALAAFVRANDGLIKRDRGGGARNVDTEPEALGAREPQDPQQAIRPSRERMAREPWVNWPETAREVAVVVVGVVLAILFGQVADNIRWAQEVKTARASLEGEMGRANRSFAYRVAVGPCISRRLDALEAVIEQAAKGRPVPRLGPVIPDIGNAMNDNIWESYRSAQTLTHFDDRELTELGGYYLQLRNIRGFMLNEADAWGYLKVLQGDPARLGPVDFAGLRVAIQHARFANYLISDISEGELASAKRLGVTPPVADAARVAEVCAQLPTQ